MRLSRGPDDADVIRARLRALLAEGSRPGWVPGDPENGCEDTEDDVEGEDPPGPPGGAADAGRHRAPDAAVRVDPGRPGARALWAAAAAAVALLLLWTWLQRPAPEPVPVGSPHPAGGTATPAPSPPTASPPGGEVAETSATVVVSVVGQVAEPGLVTLSAGSRVADAVEAAGGLLPDADPASVNLAAVVADGQQVAVGVPAAAGAPPPGAVPPPDGGAGPVNLNTADVATLDGLPGIGPVLAQRIVEHRVQHGSFRRVDDLLDVPGIGPAILRSVAAAVVV